MLASQSGSRSVANSKHVRATIASAQPGSNAGRAAICVK
jgi:hypothetical protein